MIQHSHILGIVFTIHLASAQDWYNGYYSTAVPVKNCTERDVTAFTFLKDDIYPWVYSYSIESLVNRISDRFPCGKRQYTTMIIKNAGIIENVSTNKEEFINLTHDYNYLSYYYDYSHSYFYCNQSLLNGLKRALDISPPGAFILVLSSGSIVDYNNTVLLNEIYRLLAEKKSQVFFMVYEHCAIGDLQEKVFNEISSQSFGQFVRVPLYYIGQAVSGLDLFLTKPTDSSLRILNLNLNVSGKHEEGFNITTSLTYLLIMTSGDVNITLIDPSGNNAAFDKIQSYFSGYSYLVKDPSVGHWFVNAICNGSISVKLLGFNGLDSSGKCSHSDCHLNATCEEFGGYQECTCKDGFKGDGYVCYDIDECEDYWSNQCFYSYCENSIGSYSCSCYSGFELTQRKDCIDIDECSSEYLNDCHPLAVCKNEFGSYSCFCPYGYFGDGRYCEINECQQETPCDPNIECIKKNGSYTCNDPCSNHTVLNEPWRKPHFESSYYDYWYNCDYLLNGWFRFQGKTNQKIIEHCVSEYNCGTQSPMWLNDTHPTPEEGIVNRFACASWSNDCCMWSHPILIKACPGEFFVYKLQGTPGCNMAYCVESDLHPLNCSSVKCSSDEECRTVNGVSGCYCNNDSEMDSIMDSDYPLPDLTCGSQVIRLSYSKCLLERMGSDTSTIHLRDSSCKAFTERAHISLVAIEMLPKKGHCGAELIVNASHYTYINTVYLSPKTDEIIKRIEGLVNISCSYPLSMDVSLWIAVNPFISSVSISIGGIGTYTAKMALFQYPNYSMPYEGSDVWLTTESMLHVGVMVEETKEDHLVLVMKNCYATPTADSWYPVKYDIIRNNCPNKNDPTIYVAQNGKSLHGQFSLQVFKFIGNYNKVYLHCQIRLCDTTLEKCSPNCFGMKSTSTDDNTSTHNLTLGPVYRKESAEQLQYTKAPAVMSSSEATTTSLSRLILLFYLYLIIYIYE